MSALGLKSMVFHFRSKENTIQKYDPNIPKGTWGDFSHLLGARDAISQLVCTANPASTIKTDSDYGTP